MKQGAPRGSRQNAPRSGGDVGVTGKKVGSPVRKHEEEVTLIDDGSSRTFQRFPSFMFPPCAPNICPVFQHFSNLRYHNAVLCFLESKKEKDWTVSISVLIFSSLKEEQSVGICYIYNKSTASRISAIRIDGSGGGAPVEFPIRNFLLHV